MSLGSGVYWVNIYKDGGSGELFATKEEADMRAGPERVKRMMLKIASRDGLSLGDTLIEDTT